MYFALLSSWHKFPLDRPGWLVVASGEPVERPRSMTRRQTVPSFEKGMRATPTLIRCISTGILKMLPLLVAKTGLSAKPTLICRRFTCILKMPPLPALSNGPIDVYFLYHLHYFTLSHYSTRP